MLFKFTKIKNYKVDCEPAVNGASIRFYNPECIEKEGELEEQQLYNTVKELCKMTGFEIPKRGIFSIFIREGETI